MDIQYSLIIPLSKLNQSLELKKTQKRTMTFITVIITTYSFNCYENLISSTSLHAYIKVTHVHVS